jgi:lipoyl(octanoyl) transferase
MRQTWLGTFDYVKALELQESIQQNAESDPAILGLEHPLTITLGRRGDPLKDVLIGFKALRERNIPVVAVDRGGQATLHHPGQLIIYPILSLRKLRIGAKVYVGILEATTKQLLASYGITACCRGDEPGLYTLRGKIASFGVRISRGVTSHGVAINVSNDLSEFAMIRSCGKATEAFSKLEDFGVNQPLEQLFLQWTELFRRNIDAEALTPENLQDTLTL